MKPLVLIPALVNVLPENDPDHTTPGMGQISVPVGFRPTGVFQSPAGDLSVVGLATPNAVVAMHRVVMILVNGNIQVPIGLEVGDFLGNLMLPTEQGMRPAQLFKWGKWPTTSSLLGIDPKGAA